MPEIKHNFTKGRMNKDLDERLIPNGEYRDAMNIQVSTSEGSDVGAVQNIMGNSEIYLPFITPGAVCVGSLADEKNDKLYWFVNDTNTENLIDNDASEFNTAGSEWTPSPTGTYSTATPWTFPLITNPPVWNGTTYVTTGTTYIADTTNGDYGYMETLTSKIVVGVKYRITYDLVTVATSGQLKLANHTTNDSTLNSVDGNDNVVLIAPSSTAIYKANKQIVDGGTIDTYSIDWIQGSSNQGKIRLYNSNDFDGAIDNVIIKEARRDIIVEYDVKTNTAIPVFVDLTGEVLKFDPTKIITGINIIDGMLFWTDNYSEPKKINIERSIKGTDPSGFSHTKLINLAQNYDHNSLGSIEKDIKEDHVTVIKKSPKNPPTLEYETFRDADKDYTGVIKISNYRDNPNSFIESSIGEINDFNFLKVGDYFKTRIEREITGKESFKLEWKNWMPVVIKEFTDTEAPAIPISNYRIKGKITDWLHNNFSNIAELLTENGNFDIDPGTETNNVWFGSGNTLGWNWNSTNNNVEVIFPNAGLGSVSGNVSGVTHDSFHQQQLNSNGEHMSVGTTYLVRWTIGEPANGDPLQGRLWVTFSNNIPHTVNASYTTSDGTLSSNAGIPYPCSYKTIHGGSGAAVAGSYEELVTVEPHSGYTTDPDGGGPGIPTTLQNGPWGFWPWAGPDNGSELGFNIKNYGYIGDGTELVNIHAGLAPNPYATIGTGAANVWRTFTGNTNMIKFNRSHLINPLNDNQLRNITPSPLTENAWYWVDITISNYSGTGLFGVDEDGSFQSLAGLKLNADVPNAVIENSNYDSLQLDELTVSIAPDNEWAGQGGRITGYVKGPVAGAATGYLYPDIYAHKDCSATMEVSIQVRETKYFNGTIDNVSVEEIDSEQAQVEVRIDSIEGIPPTVESGSIEMNYAIDKFDTEDKLFEEKFPRFAIRYKYEDGEYSALSPFTEAVFIPGTFNYHPSKGYNLGMTNNLKSLTIKGFTRLLPKDVKSIDILYKEENSPNIYIVDTIKDLTTTKYKIDSETIRNGLAPSNQLLRPWDNVPRKALAQDVVGNRIVYGNYLQNYDLIDSVTGKDYSVDIDVDVTSSINPSRSGKGSIKSLREYQVGVVYTDKYGRETPVQIDPKATFKVDKSNASEINQIEVGLLNEGHPVNMKYFKFYIKDTGGTYYNLAMDRYYDAEDDNIWLAFPSTDRNKIDIDDFLILKKGSGNILNNENKWSIPNIVRGKAQYKVLDIKNEAPDFIKRKETLIASKSHSNTSTGTKFFVTGDLPVVDDINFSIDHERISSNSYANLHNDFGTDSSVKYYITLSNTTTNRVTNRYKVVQLFADDIAKEWKFTLEKPFTNEINSFSNDKTGKNTTQIIDNTYLNIYKNEIDNSSAYKFDGRFFVKVYNDDIFKKLLREKQDDDENIEYKATGVSRKIYSLETYTDSNRIKKHYDDTTGVTQAFFEIETMTTTGSSGPSSDADGLNRKVTDQPSHEEFNWGHYSEVTSNFANYLGTLNGKISRVSSGTISGAGQVSIITNDVLMRDFEVWRDYDAYFRGINVYLGNDAIKDRVTNVDVDNTNDKYLQKFEDVWFIDNATSAGHFIYSVASNTGLGWDTTPNDWLKASMGFIGDGHGNGILELSFGAIQPEEWSTDTSGWDRDETFYDLDGANSNYSEREADFIKYIAIGSQFRFQEDPTETIYTVLDVWNFLRVRYESLNHYSNHATQFMSPDPESRGLKANHLFPFHARAVAGKATGIEGVSGSTTTNAHNIWGDANWTGNGLSTEIYPTDGSDNSSGGHTYATCTYLRPSNYTRNWRMLVDKSPYGKWNPVLDTGGVEITNGVVIQLQMPTVATVTKNSLIVNSITGVGTDKGQLEEGMVLKKYNDGTEKDLAIPAIVSKISENVDALLGLLGYTIHFKTYDGSDDLATAGNWIGAITASDNLYFYQYPMNGLSPNSVRNLNYFRNIVGAGATDGGTAALGYTLEWLEEKSSRSEEDILPKNPAIWETKPKEKPELDVYYEASGQIPIEIELTSENIQDYIPIGSIVEYENKPHLFPPGTTIIDINVKNEQIILSNSIKIVDTPFNLISYPSATFWAV